MKKGQIFLTIFLSFLLISLIICQCFIIFSSKQKNYLNSDLTKQLTFNKETMAYGQAKQKINSNNKYSYAINYPKTKKDQLNDQINIIINREINNLKKKTSIDQTHDTLIINYEIYKSNNYVSLVILKKFLSDNKLNISTYIFEEDSGMFIKNIIDKNKLKIFKEKYSVNTNFIALDKNNVIFYSIENNDIKKIILPNKDIKEYLTINSTLENTLSRNINPNQPMVALTFDDGPHPTYGPMIIDSLKKNNAVATFFEVGYMLEKYSSVSISAKEIGCEIGSHTYNHINLKKASEKERINDLKLMDDLFFSIFKEYPTLLRPPYGAYTNELTNITNQALILWSIDTNDWQYRDKDKIINYIKEQGDLDGNVILMHSTYKETAEALEELVPWLIDEGYQLVTVTELIENKYNTNTNNEKIFGYYYFG